MDSQDLQDPEKLLTIWVKHLDKIVNKINNTISMMIGMKPKDSIELDTVLLNKSYPKENVLAEDSIHKMETKKDERQTLSGGKIPID